MATKQEAVLNQLTERGLKDYKELLKTLIRIYNEEETKWVYGDNTMVLGFGSLNLMDKADCFSAIKFMAFLLGINIEEENHITFITDGSKIETKRLEIIEVN